MFALLKWLHLIALIVWVGEIVFFSFVGAPAIFRNLPTEEAGRAVGAIFPLYYRVGYGCGGVLVLSAACFALTGGMRAWWSLGTLLAVVMLALTAYAGLSVAPRATQLRPQLHVAAPDPAVKAEFDQSLCARFA